MSIAVINTLKAIFTEISCPGCLCTASLMYVLWHWLFLFKKLGSVPCRGFLNIGQNSQSKTYHLVWKISNQVLIIGSLLKKSKYEKWLLSTALLFHFLVLSILNEGKTVHMFPISELFQKPRIWARTEVKASFLWSEHLETKFCCKAFLCNTLLKYLPTNMIHQTSEN